MLLTLFGLGLAGCEVMPITRFKPTLHNPLPQMVNIAVVPFYNDTGNPHVDGREFAQYFALELQRIQGFKVVANKTVEDVMMKYDLHKFESVDDIRYLAQLLKVDAVVIGKIHGFSMDYPPYAKFETDWYHVNPYMHPIPIGYALPWGTEYERYIPDKIVLLTEMELAKEQLATQTPAYEPIKRQNAKDPDDFDDFTLLAPPKQARRPESIRQMSATQAAATIPNNLREESTDEDFLLDKAVRKQDLAMGRILASTGVPYVPDATPVSDREKKEEIFRSSMEHPLKPGPWQSEIVKEDQLPWSAQNSYPAYQQSMQNPGGFVGNYPGFPQPEGLPPGQLTAYGWVAEPIAPVRPMYPLMPGMPVEGEYGMVMGEPDRFPGLTSDWPDPRGLIPDGPKPERPVGKEKNDGPIISWSNVYNGNDSEFMQALQDYDFLFRDDKRINGKQTILTNRSEFIPFCCRMHIWEIFSSRGGAGPAEKVHRAWKPWQGGERPY
ncbi:MAG: hypothetical protein LBI05_07130 [Planctomycetaceae bacterium]|nr:hypothetical protein [Planctomycetaceae bacterium]